MSNESDRRRLDAAVVGAGPAGAVCAAILARHGARVVILRAARPRRQSVELVSGLARSQLEASLSWVGAGCQVTQTVSLWGSADPVAWPAMLQPAGAGLAVLRSQFDAELVRRAGTAVVEARATAVERVPGGWRIAAAGRADYITARWLVVASGQTGHLLGRHPVRMAPRAVAVTGWHAAAHGSPAEHALLLEADAQGWWWSLPHPRGGVWIGHWLAGELPATWPDRLRWWSRQLERTQLISASVCHRAVSPEMFVQPAAVATWPTVTGSGWIAVGDAAFVPDPLSGQGIDFAVESGSRAAALLQCDPHESGQAAYAHWVAEVSAAHVRFRADFLRQVKLSG